MAACTGGSITGSATYTLSSCNTLTINMGVASFITVQYSFSQIPLLKVPFTVNTSAIKTFGLSVLYTLNGGSEITASLSPVSISINSNSCSTDPSSVSSIAVSNTSIAAGSLILYQCSTTNGITQYTLYVSMSAGSNVYGVNISITN